MNGLEQLLGPQKRKKPKPPKFPFPSPPDSHFPGNQSDRLNRSYWQILTAIERIMTNEGGT